jgi:hypothetical protein
MKLKLEIFILITIISLGLFFSSFRIVKQKALIIRDVEQNTRTVMPVPEREFTLSFIHSVEKTPVYEIYNIEGDNKLTLKETKYYSLGVGLPFSEANGKFSNDRGEFDLKFNRTFNFIPIRVSPIPRHQINIGGKTYELLDFAKPEDLIIISAVDKWYVKNIRRR